MERNPFQRLSKEWLAIPRRINEWINWTIFDLRLVVRKPKSLHLISFHSLHKAETPFHNSAISLQFNLPFFISLQIKPVEYGKYFQFYLGWRPNGWAGGKFRLATYEKEVIYNPGLAEGWQEGWS